jgi:hypothetical protein
MNPNRKNSYGDPSLNEIDFQVYTLPYKNKIKQDSKLLQIIVNPEEPDARSVMMKKAPTQNKQHQIPFGSLQSDPNEFNGDDCMVP